MAESRIRIVVEADDRASRTLRGVGDAMSNMGSQAKGVGGSLRNIFEFAGGQLVADGIRNIASSLVDLGGQALDSYATFERLTMSLETFSARELINAGVTNNMQDAIAMSGERAQELLGWIEKLAVESPFQSGDIANAFRTAQAYGFTSDQAMRLTQATVDFAAGAGISGAMMDRITLALGQIAARGKVSSQELNQLSEAGIGARQILADAFGVTTAQMQEMIEKGMVPANIAIEAITQSLEKDFGGAAQRQANTFSGLISSLSDLKEIGLREFFTGTFSAIQPLLIDFVNTVTDPAIKTEIKAWGDALGQNVAAGVRRVQSAIAAFKSGGIAGLAQALQIPPIVIGTINFAAQNIDILKGAALGLGGVLAAGAIVSGLTAVAGALVALTSPIGLITLGAMVLGAAWTTNFGGIQEKTQAVIDFLRPGFESLLSWISEASQGNFAPLQAGLQGALDTVTATIESFHWADFVTKLGDWGTYIAPIAWDALIVAVDWATYIGKLVWDNAFIPLLDWTTYISPLAWNTFVASLSDWATYVANLDWNSYVTAALDWASFVGQLTWDSVFVPTLDWAAYISPLAWDAMITALSDWGAYIAPVAWNVFVATVDWATYIGQLVWNNAFIPALDWVTYISPLAWNTFVASLSDWATYVTNLDWNSYVTAALDWASFVGQLTWDNAFIPALDWATYVSPLAWDAFVTSLSDWGSYIASLDWTSIITTTIDWATWVPALAWTEFVNILEWSVYASVLAWDAFVGVLDWATAAGTGIDWSGFVSALSWESVATALDWSTYIVSFTWDSFITKLEWTGTVAQMQNWATYITSINWGEYITSLDWKSIITTTIDWGVWVTLLPWNTFVTALNWITFVGSFAWTNYITQFQWSTVTQPLTWSNFVTSLSNWGAYITSLPWAEFVATLGNWGQFVGEVAWDAFVENLSWPSFVPAFSWSSFVTAIDLSSYVPAFPGWAALINALNPFGGSAEARTNAAGTNSWVGGPTWVGERGAELAQYPNGQWAWLGAKGPVILDLPAGTKIFSHEDSLKMAGGQMGAVAVGMNAEGTTRPPAIWPGGGSQFADLTQAIQLGAKYVGQAGDQAGKKMAKAFESSMNKITDKLKSALSSIPGLMSPSQVSEQDMVLAQAGLYQDNVDEVLRRVKSAANNEQDKAKFSADIQAARDALGRIGITASDNIKVMAAQFEKAWADQSLFSNKDNLSLYNMDAVQRSLQQQQMQAQGKNNIMELFGIPPDQVQTQALAAGVQIAAGLSQGMTIDGATTADAIIKSAAASITAESVAPLGAALSAGIAGSVAGSSTNKETKGAGTDLGSQLVGAINTSLSDSAAFDTTGQTILQKIIDSWSNLNNIDVASKIANAMNVNLGTPEAIQVLQDVGEKLFKIIFQGYDAAASGADYVAPVNTGINNNKKKNAAANATSTTNVTPPVSGKSYGRAGGLMAAGAGAGGGVVINNTFMVASPLDIVDVAYQVADIIQKRTRR